MTFQDEGSQHLLYIRLVISDEHREYILSTVI